WIAGFRIADNPPTGRIQRLPRDAGKLERKTVRQAHMAIKAVHKYRRVRRVSVDQFFRRYIRLWPALMIPIAASDPSSFGKLRREIANAFGKLLRSISIAQIDAGELESTAHEVRVRIVEARKHQLALRVDLFCVGAGKFIDFFR